MDGVSGPDTVPRRRLARDQRRGQLLDTAEGLFASQGYEATTMEDVARAAGVTRAVVYAHFESKDDVLRAGVQRARTELGARLMVLREQAAGMPLRELVTRGGEVFFALLEEAPQRWALLFAPTLPVSRELSEHVRVLRQETIMQIVDVAARVRTSAPPERVEAVSYAISGVGEQLGRWWLTRSDVPRGPVVAYYSDFVVDAVSGLIDPE